MLDFNFYNPTQIVFSQNCLAELDKLVPKDAKGMISMEVLKDLQKQKRKIKNS